MTHTMPAGLLLPPIPQVAAQAGYDPVRWYSLRTSQQARIINRLFDAKSLGATNVAASQTPRLADEAGEGLWQSDFRNHASTSAWWSKVTKTDKPPWDIQLVFVNGGSALRSLERMLMGGVKPPWKLRYSGGAMQDRAYQPVGAFNDACCAALYAYAQENLPRMGMPAADVDAKLASIDYAGIAKTVTQDVLILCILLTYYRPWADYATSNGGPAVAGTPVKYFAAPLGELTYAGLALPTNPDVLVKMLQLPTDVRPWQWGEFYNDPWPMDPHFLANPGYLPDRRLSPLMLAADGKLVTREGAGGEPIKPGELPPYIPAEVRLPYRPGTGFRGFTPDTSPWILLAMGAGIYLALRGNG